MFFPISSFLVRKKDYGDGFYVCGGGITIFFIATFKSLIH